MSVPSTSSSGYHDALPRQHQQGHVMLMDPGLEEKRDTMPDFFADFNPDGSDIVELDDLPHLSERKVDSSHADTMCAGEPSATDGASSFIKVKTEGEGSSHTKEQGKQSNDAAENVAKSNPASDGTSTEVSITKTNKLATTSTAQPGAIVLEFTAEQLTKVRIKMSSLSLKQPATYVSMP
jgi:hypothetical protein